MNPNLGPRGEQTKPLREGSNKYRSYDQKQILLLIVQVHYIVFFCNNYDILKGKRIIILYNS